MTQRKRLGDGPFRQVEYVGNLSSLESWCLFHPSMFCLPVGCVLVSKPATSNLRKITAGVFFCLGKFWGMEISQVYPSIPPSPRPFFKWGMLGVPLEHQLLPLENWRCVEGHVPGLLLAVFFYKNIQDHTSCVLPHRQTCIELTYTDDYVSSYFPLRIHVLK